jgi:uncharacterized membrane protein (UPF0127 family)
MKSMCLMSAVLVVAACSQPARNPGAGPASTPRPTPAPPHAVLPDGLVLELELALTPDEISTGLMFRPSLADDRGMLFLFDHPRLPAFWMKNMLIPLDLVFLDGTGTIVDVIADVPPCASDPCPNYPPSNPAQAVLEINAGSAASHGIEIGSTIVFERVPGYPRE